MEQTFEQKAKEWLEPFGYGIHSSNPNKTNITFVCYDKLGESYPAITCRTDGIDETASLTYEGLKYFIGLHSGTIAFKHSEIGRYISIMHHYATLCENNSPF